MLKSYKNIIVLFIALVFGVIFGSFFPALNYVFKPLADIFLNLLFVTLVPFIFFGVALAVNNNEFKHTNFSLFLIKTLLIFVVLLLIAESFMLFSLYIFDTNEIIKSNILNQKPNNHTESIGNIFVDFLTVSDFNLIFSRKNILALLIFSLIIGFAIKKSGNLGKPFLDFISSGNIVFHNVLKIVMHVAPVGIAAFVAHNIVVLGATQLTIFAKPLVIYYIAGIVYFFIFYSLYAFIYNKKNGLKIFWSSSYTPSLTALSTCSSMATIPLNIEAAKKIGIKSSIYNLVIPIGGIIHKHGSAMSSIVKIYVAFLLLNKNFFTLENIFIALFISIIVSVVEGGIPNGGFIGELLMISLYSFPPEIIPAIMIIATLVDPLATLLNAIGNIIATMFADLFSRIKEV